MRLGRQIHHELRGGSAGGRARRAGGPPGKSVAIHKGLGEGAGVAADAASGNDPSAGSPTETLLRLLLPLNDRV